MKKQKDRGNVDEKHNMDSKGHNSAAPGNIVFEYGERHFGDFLSFCGTNLNVIPEKGLVIIFPAWLTHHVYPFESDVERVSVSGNISLVTEKPLDKTLY